MTPGTKEYEDFKKSYSDSIEKDYSLYLSGEEVTVPNFDEMHGEGFVKDLCEYVIGVGFHSLYSEIMEEHKLAIFMKVRKIISDEERFEDLDTDRTVDQLMVGLALLLDRVPLFLNETHALSWVLRDTLKYRLERSHE